MLSLVILLMRFVIWLRLVFEFAILKGRDLFLLVIKTIDRLLKMSLVLVSQELNIGASHVWGLVGDGMDRGSFKIKIDGRGIPVRDAVGEMYFEDLGNGKGRVEMRMSYKSRFGPVGWLMDKLVLHRMLPVMFVGMMGRFERFVLAGQGINVDGDVLLDF